MFLNNRIYGQFSIILIMGCVLQCANTSPIFFSNPFGVVKMADGETENVSIYTTTENSLHDKTGSTESTSVYQQIARNVIERIATPVVSHFILSTSTGNSSRIISTTHRTTENDNKLELTEETIIEPNNTMSSSSIFEDNGINNETEDLNGRELINPKLISSNPSFNRKLTDKDRSRPERIVLYPYISAVKEPEKTASEVNDLNMDQRDFFDSVSDLQDDTENEIDPEDIQTRANDRSDTSSLDDDFEENNGEDFGNPENDGEKNLNENGFIYVLELIGSAITIGWGAISAIFQRKMSAVMSAGN